MTREAPSRTDSPRRLVVAVDGHVQGVGFRMSTVAVAQGFAVGGYVQNQVDGSVRVVAEGAEPELLRFLDALRAAPVYRFVRQEQVNWMSATGAFAGFDIRYG